MEDKENIPSSDALNFSAMNFPVNLFSQQAQILAKKAKKQQAKVQKNLNNSVRAGDWICLVCNNLNFSFRNECNRCQMQTKKQNYIQNLLLITDKTAPGLAERTALKDLTNVSIEDAQTPRIMHQSLNPSFHSEGELRMNSHHPPGLGSNQRVTQEKNKFDDFEFSPNYGFENALLLTPPRFNNHRQDFTSPTPDLTGSNKRILPYQSPKQLPSVSPILRKVLSYNENSEEHYNAKFFKYKGATQRSNSSGEKTDEKAHRQLENCHSFDDTATDNFNFDEMNKCIQETILNDHNHNHHAYPMGAYLDYSGFNNMLMKENINPALLNVEKNYTTLFAGINMNEDPKNQSKKERKADWICQWCSNLNYSFRKFCNRCQVVR